MNRRPRDEDEEAINIDQVLSGISDIYPLVPVEQRPKPLYVSVNIASRDTELLKEKGWEVIDVRVLPTGTSAERNFRFEAYMTGLLMGSIKASRTLLDVLELEAKVLGKDQASAKPLMATESLDELLSIKSNRAFKGTSGQNDSSYDPFNEEEKKIKKGKK